MATSNVNDQHPGDTQEEYPSFSPHAQPDRDVYLHDHDNWSHTGTIPTLINSYEGYEFFKLDPLPRQEAAVWARAERTKLHFEQCKLYRMVRKRAKKTSAANQYLELPKILQEHVLRLIHDQKSLDPSWEWSCVYAKERRRACKARSAGRDSMTVILLKRPRNTGPYPRTPMGDLVDLDCRQDRYQSSNGPDKAEALSQYAEDTEPMTDSDSSDGSWSTEGDDNGTGREHGPPHQSTPQLEDAS